VSPTPSLTTPLNNNNAQAAIVETAALAALALPASVAIDAALDRATGAGGRVARVANARTDSGVYVYAARPPAAAAADKTTANKGSGGAPAVVLLHQIFGLTAREAGLCDLLAERGFYAVAPDLFDGASTAYIPRALALGAQHALAPGADWGVGAALKAVEWARSQPGVDPNRVAVAGFCLGGAAALRAAVAKPDAVAAVGVFYGRPLEQGALGVRYSPIRGKPVWAAYGGRDSQFSTAMVDEFEASLAASGAVPSFQRFPDQGHAFVTDATAARAPGTDAHRAFESFVEFLDSNLAVAR
jgi:carboxymethylenebutenolidase